MAFNVTMDRTTKGKGFAGVGDAAQQAASAPPAPIGPPAPAPIGPPAPTDNTAPADNSPSPYDSQDGEHPDTGHAHVMQDIGNALQQMMQQDPQTHKSVSDLIDQFMGKGIDYDAESKRLRGLIEARQTPKAPNWVAAGVGSWAGGPSVAGKFSQLQQAATAGEAKKQEDLTGTEAALLKEHIDDLKAGKTARERILGSVISGVAGGSKEETKQAGAMERAEFNAQTRKDLQDRALGAAEERVRLHIQSREDISNKDRTAGQVMHLYESLLKQSEKDVTGATKPVYTADQAMQLALKSILPQVKAGVAAVKTGKAPEGTTPTAPAPTAQSKFAQWKAQQAAKKPAGK